MPKSQVPQILALLPSHSIIPCHRGNWNKRSYIKSRSEKVVQLNLEFVDIHGWWYMGVFVRDRCVWYQCIPNSGWILRRHFFLGILNDSLGTRGPYWATSEVFSSEKRSDVTVCDSFILWLSFLSPSTPHPTPCTLAKTLVYLFPVFWPVFLVLFPTVQGVRKIRSSSWDTWLSGRETGVEHCDFVHLETHSSGYMRPMWLEFRWHSKERRELEMEGCQRKGRSKELRKDCGDSLVAVCG